MSTALIFTARSSTSSKAPYVARLHVKRRWVFVVIYWKDSECESGFIEVGQQAIACPSHAEARGFERYHM